MNNQNYKYLIEFSEQYKKLAPEGVYVNSDTPKNALAKFLNSHKVYREIVKVNEPFNADVCVSLKNVKTTKNYYKFKAKEQIIKERPNLVEQHDINEARKLIEQGVINVFHGTKDPSLTPSYHFNNSENDYGKGFYTTPSKELGKEWAYAAYTKGKKGYVYEYSIDLRGLKVLNLTEIDSMHWLAELVAHRKLNNENAEALQDTVEQLIAKYKLDTSEYDVIIGYRADDSYFVYAEDFIGGRIYRDTLETALRNGELGLQVFIKSRKAFGRLKKVSGPEEVPERYKELYSKRDKNAREKYKRDRVNQTSRLKQRIYEFL